MLKRDRKWNQRDLNSVYSCALRFDRRWINDEWSFMDDEIWEIISQCNMQKFIILQKFPNLRKDVEGKLKKILFFFELRNKSISQFL